MDKKECNNRFVLKFNKALTFSLRLSRKMFKILCEKKTYNFNTNTNIQM